MRGAVVLILLLDVLLGSCAGADGHPPDPAGPERCDTQLVSIEGGGEREPDFDRTVPAAPPGHSDTTVVWHCGPPPDAAPPIVAVNSSSLSPHGPRAPPRG